jgi:hypothetical protein
MKTSGMKRKRRMPRMIMTNDLEPKTPGDPGHRLLSPAHVNKEGPV